MLKDLFFPITGAAVDQPALAIAERVALKHGARLIVSVTATVPAAVATPWGFAPAVALAELVAQVEIHASRRAVALRDWAAKSEAVIDVRVDRTHIVDPTEALTRQARYADLAFLAPPRGDDAPVLHAFFASFLMGSGRPVLVVPINFTVRRFRKVLLAWKPTREATRAIHDALALFDLAEAEVLVIDPEIGDHGHENEPGADIAAHLAKHGLRANVARRPCGELSVAQIIRTQAADTGADLIVAGGYGHWRMREWALGGTTRELLESLELPVLFSH